MNRQSITNPAVHWDVDVINAFVVEHATGLRIEFTALAESGHFEGVPRDIPHDMPARTLSRLILQGFEEFRAAVDQHSDERTILVPKMH